MYLAIGLLIVLPLVGLAIIGVVAHALLTVRPDPEDERWSIERLAYLRTQARREGRYWE
jgi:hypothetical protein